MDRVGQIPLVSDLWDAVTSDTFFTILGTALTTGQYGWISGILNVTGAQGLALQEGMKALAGGAGIALQGFVRTGKVVPPSFVEAWQGQVLYRTKVMIDRGAPEVANRATREVTSYVSNPTTVAAMEQAWNVVKQGEAYARDPELAARAYLDDLQRTCLAITAGPVRGPGDLCRKDALAQAANLANLATIFDTTDWDIPTGEPPPLRTTNLTSKQAIDLWLAAVRAAGTSSPDVPEVARALEVVHAARRREADQATRNAAAAHVLEELDRACSAGVPHACRIANRTKVLRRVPVGSPPAVGVPGGAANGERLSRSRLFPNASSSTPPGVPTYVLMGALLASPFWLPRVFPPRA